MKKKKNSKKNQPKEEEENEEDEDDEPNFDIEFQYYMMLQAVMLMVTMIYSGIFLCYFPFFFLSNLITTFINSYV